jgi:hypothetical protein
LKKPEVSADFKNALILAVDPGIDGWIACVTEQGVHGVRPVPIFKIEKLVRKKLSKKEAAIQKKKTGLKTISDNYLSYPKIASFIRQLKKRAIEAGYSSLIIVHENTNVMPRQHVVSTVKQHVAIAVWPITAACLKVDCYEVMSSQWKQALNISLAPSEKKVNGKKLNAKQQKAILKDKSVKLCQELCPKLKLTGSNRANAVPVHDLAEAVLIGYYFLNTLGK